jgi:hypothetical protein
MQIDIFVRGMAAWEVVDVFTRALSTGWKGKQVVKIAATFAGFSEVIGVSKQAEELSDWDQLKQRIATFKSDPLFLDVHSVTVTLSGPSSLTYHSQYGDQRWTMVRLDSQDQDFAQVRDLVRELKSLLPVVPRSDMGKTAFTEPQLEGFRFAEKVIGSFATEAARLSQDTAKHFGEFVAGVKQRTLELEAQFQARHSELETTFRERQQAVELDHQAKLKEIEERERAHAEEVKQFELRNNTAVRRDLLKEIRNKIEEQKTIKITEDTLGKRRIIHQICGGTLVLSAIAIGVFIWKVSEATTVDWKLLVPLSTWTAIFVSTSIFYIRWNDQWFLDHAKVEFENRKFSADILRASWVAELFFEWAEKKGVSIPPELVASFTRNLFEGVTADSRLHPADQLTELLKQVSTLEVSKGAFKITKAETKSESRQA